MPAYCTAINCKTNGFSSPTLSFFKFPLSRPNILAKWVTSMRRDIDWVPTKHSRLCSIHFNEHCFFIKKGCRLRLLPDAIPTIFDFRTIKSNRKKALENTLLDMDKSEYRENDKNLYELETDTIINQKFEQKCRICKGQADCDITLNSVVNTKKGKISLEFIVNSIFAYKLTTSKNDNFVCLSCSKRLITTFRLRIDLDECNEKIDDSIKSDKENSSDDEMDEFICSEATNRNVKDPLDTQILPKPDIETDLTNLNIYCSSCNKFFKQKNIGIHLSSCEMRKEADLKQIHPKDRQVIVCFLCKFLLYKHNANEHLNVCGKLGTKIIT